MLRMTTGVAIAAAVPLCATAQDDSRYTLRRDLADHYAQVLPAETRFEKNIVPTTVIVYGPSASVPACKEFDHTYKADDILHDFNAGKITEDDAVETMVAMNCMPVAPGSWGEAVRAYVNGGLLVDFQFIVGIDPDDLADIDALYWVAARPLADISTHERAMDLAILPFR